jgi:hypothetical protein
MKSTWIGREITYDGKQLRSHWILGESRQKGDAIAAFAGPANVPVANMVDLEDVAANAPILSKSMLHFICEHFDCSLELAIARQRLLIAIAAEELSRRAKDSAIKRRGDDNYDGEKKFSVSIATASPVSCLIHFGLNIVAEGAPVAAAGLSDYGIEAWELAGVIMKRYCEEIASMQDARCKVRPVA